MKYLMALIEFRGILKTHFQRFIVWYLKQYKYRIQVKVGEHIYNVRLEAIISTEVDPV